MNAQYRKFDSGATRNLDQHKLDYEAFLCPLVLKRYAQYMHANRALPDGSMRAGDNWQEGIPPESYMKSLSRHFMEAWTAHRGYPADDIESSLCAIIFNASGYLHERLKAQSRFAATSGGMDAQTGPKSDIPDTSADATVEELLPPGSQPGEE